MTQFQYLFNSSGAWIAFRVGRYVYNADISLVGWLPWDEHDVYTLEGEYYATIFPGNRLYRRLLQPYRGYPGYPPYPPYPGYPGYPGFAGYSPLPLGTEDLN
jgi:hypothetical protein